MVAYEDRYAIFGYIVKGINDVFRKLASNWHK